MNSGPDSGSMAQVAGYPMDVSHFLDCVSSRKALIMLEYVRLLTVPSRMFSAVHHCM